jgi:apolipoprotein N-acyltransferase
VSAVIDPHGKILAQTGEYQARYLDMEVRRNTTITMADRVGAWPEYAFALLGLLASIGLGGATTTLRRVRSLIPGSRGRADTLPDALDGEAAPNGSADDAGLHTAAKGRAR